MHALVHMHFVLPACFRHTQVQLHRNRPTPLNGSEGRLIMLITLYVRPQWTQSCAHNVLYSSCISVFLSTSVFVRTHLSFTPRDGGHSWKAGIFLIVLSFWPTLNGLFEGLDRYISSLKKEISAFEWAESESSRKIYGFSLCFPCTPGCSDQSYFSNLWLHAQKKSKEQDMGFPLAQKKIHNYQLLTMI